MEPGPPCLLRYKGILLVQPSVQSLRVHVLQGDVHGPEVLPGEVGCSGYEVSLHSTTGLPC